MKMKWRIAMGMVRSSGWALVLCLSLVVLVSAAPAQATCTPVVLLFRHAEDTNPPPPLIFHLTPTGEFHALMYRFMVPAFADGTKYCEVKTVYAATKVDKPGGARSATNSFFTAQPLAQQIMKKDPIIKVGLPCQNPDQDNEKCRLYEYMGNGNDAPPHPNYDKDVSIALRTALLASANKSESSAIFWTSQGLHVLGGAVIDKTSNVPDKTGTDQDAKDVTGTPPRNAVYVFEAVGAAPNITQFSDTPLRKQTPGVDNRPEVLAGFYVQCFNHVESSSALNPHTPHFVPITEDPVDFYCGYGGQSDLGGKPPAYSKNPPICNYDDKGKLTSICDGTIPAAQNIKLNATICNTTNLSPSVDSSTGIYGGTFGACQP
jgi:hypothetical protein